LVLKHYHKHLQDLTSYMINILLYLSVKAAVTYNYLYVFIINISLNTYVSTYCSEAKNVLNIFVWKV